MSVTEEEIKSALQDVNYPGFSRSIVSFGLVKGIEVSGSEVRVHLNVSTRDPAVPEALKKEVGERLSRIQGVGRVGVQIDVQPAPAAAGQPQATAIDGVGHIVAIASGKGGVGKSTVAANLAVAMARQGAAVGLCDCDIYGPSVGIMFGISERPLLSENQDMILPHERHGVKLMSMGFLLDDGSPAVLRGPMVTRYTQQFLRNVVWGDLDILLLDLPPGTGDIQLTIVQTLALSGAIIVTTPQEVALIDARKASGMFARVNVPVLGLVENMSYFLCPSDGKRYDIFGTDGGRKEAARLGVPLLGQVPIDIPTREAGDAGTPVAASANAGKSAAGIEFHRMAKIVLEKMRQLC